MVAAGVLAAACGEDARAPLTPGTSLDASVGDTRPTVDAAPNGDAHRIIDAGFMDARVATGPDAQPAADAEPADSGPLATPIAPVVFIHGVGGSASEFDVMIDRLVDAGWPRDHLFAIQFANARWGCNMDNAVTIQTEVARILNQTGQSRIDLVAHSMGTLSSRWFVKFLGGTDLVDTYVTIGGMHHGLRTSCLSPLNVCVWREICERNEMVMMLNADPATPGDLHWVSIYSTADDRVPNWSSELDGAEMIIFDNIPHAGADGLLENEDVQAEVERVLQYPPW